MKFLLSIITVLSVSACSSNHIVTSTNPDLLFIGEQSPTGYPKTYVERLQGYCVSVTETWRKDSYQGTTIWFKDTTRKTTNCAM